MKTIIDVPTVIRERLVTFKGDPNDRIFLAAKRLVSDDQMTKAWAKIRKATEAKIYPPQKGESKSLSRSRLQAKDDFVDHDLGTYFDYVLMAYEDSFEACTDWGRMSQPERDKWDAELEAIETKLRRHLSCGPVPMSKDYRAAALVPIDPMTRERVFKTPEDMTTEEFWQSTFRCASGRRRPQQLKSPGEAMAQRKLFVLRLSDHLDCHFAKIHIAAITCPTRTLFDGNATDSWVSQTLKGRRLPSRAPTFRAK